MTSDEPTASTAAHDATLADGRRVRLTPFGPRAFRVQIVADAKAFGSSLVRYGIVRPAWTHDAHRATRDAGALSIDAGSAKLSVDLADGRLTLTAADGGAVVASAAPPRVAEGFVTEWSLSAGEEVYGLGDVTRDRLAKRGHRAKMWVKNVAAYVPIPFVMSDRGWGLFANTTWRHAFDVGATTPDVLRVAARQGPLDLFLFTGDFPAMLDDFTRLTGRPALLPNWAYGFTFVSNQQANAREMVDDCLNLRREQIPCDLIGLEPGWMEQHYDATVDKRWHPERFYLAPWDKAGTNGFLAAVGRMGFKVSLWLCCDYDLTFEAERRAGATSADKPKAVDAPHADDFEQDPHFGHDAIRADKITKPGEAWFEHLKKFVDQGASAFKMDGAFQVNDHPDRKYGNGMTDEEAHNLYPTLLNQQMSLGFTEHTGRRAMIYSSGGYVGIQRFAATWAGDTGGGPKPLASMLNHSFVGHSNVSCDMDVYTKEGIHFGFLQAWSQVCSWAYWRHPWLLGDTLLPIFKTYAALRYRLLPYLYAMAHVAHDTGWPMMRAMSLAYPHDPHCRERMQQYLLGDSLLVGAFTDTVYLPPGAWTCWWTGQTYEGGREVTIDVPPDRGGPLLVRGGAILPMAAPGAQYIGQKPADVVELHVWPGGDGAVTLCEDDGTTTAHDRGEVARTPVRCEQRGDVFRVSVGATSGTYAGMIASRRLELHVHGSGPSRATLDGKVINTTGAAGVTMIDLSDGAAEVELTR